MQKLVWQNANGDTVDLTSGNYGITEWEGFSNAGLNVQSQQVPFQDGAVFLDALIEPRELSVTLAMQDNNNLELRYQLRRELIHILNPKLGEGYLIYTNDFTSKRIKCIPQIPLFQNKNSNDSGTPKASLAWTACEPYWEDLEETVVNLESGRSYTIENEGDVKLGIKFNGLFSAVTNPMIKNITQNKTIKINGNVEEGLYINTNLGEKTVNTQIMGYDILNNGGEVRDVIYIPTLALYLAVGYPNLIMTSQDGINWKYGKGDLIQNIYGVAYSEELNLMVATGSGKALVSSDGENWEKIDIDTGSSLTTQGIIWSKSKQKFVAVGAKGQTSISKIWYSSDGINWTMQSIGANVVLTSIRQDGELFVITGQDGLIATSADLENWTIKYSGTSELTDSAYGNGTYVVVGYNGQVLTSTDGETWTQRNSGEDSILFGIAYSEKLSIFIAIGQLGFFLKSTDGITWTRVDINFQRNKNSITYSTTLEEFIIGADFRAILISEDGINMNPITTIYEFTIQSIAYSLKNKLFVCAGQKTGDDFHGHIIIKNDNNNWKDITIQTSIRPLYDVKYFEDINYFYCVGNNGEIIRSQNGETWERITSGVSNNLRKIIKTDDMFIIVGEGGTILKSTDGENWTQQNSGVSVKLNSVISHNGIFIVVGENQTILKSTDGETWVQKSSGSTTQNDFQDVLYSEKYKVFVIVGNNIYTSTDGENWTLKSTLSGTYLSIVYSNIYNIFILVGYSGRIAMTIDLKEVVEIRYFSTNTDFHKTIIAGQNIIGVGRYTTIIQIEYLIKDNIINQLDSNSDLTLGLLQGKNLIYITQTDGIISGSISYRQKYIGV